MNKICIELETIINRAEEIKMLRSEHSNRDVLGARQNEKQQMFENQPVGMFHLVLAERNLLANGKIQKILSLNGARGGGRPR
jgi:hypothetical protein